MIERYNVKEVEKIWSEEDKFRRFLEIEILLCEALEKERVIPKGVAGSIRKRAQFSLERIKEIEKRTNHDVVAFLEDVSSSIGDYAKYLHMGLTSSDLLDTTLAWQIKDVNKIILEDLDKLIVEVKKKALKYKDTVCIGRTHGVHAEVYSFGLKFAYLYYDLIQERELLKNSIDYVCQGKISGAVGNFAYLTPKVEEYICKKIGIKNALVSTQIVSRERFAYYLSILTLIGTTLERFATEIRHLHRTEVQEVLEPFYRGQKGSSAMPHKQNPIICERICGLARILRGNMLVSYENVNLWHERDISHSSTERMILPDSTTLIVYMLRKFYNVVKDLNINTHKMLENLNLTRGLIFSQSLLIALMKKGLKRLDAYNLIQKISLNVINQNLSFKEEVLKDEEIRKFLSEEEINYLFEPIYYLSNVDSIYKRLGIV